MITLLLILLTYQDIQMAIKKITTITKSVPDKVKPAPTPKSTNSKVGDKLKAGDTRTVGGKTSVYSAPKDTTGFGGSAYIKKNYVDATTKADSSSSKKSTPAPSGKVSLYPLSTKDPSNISLDKLKSTRSPKVVNSAQIDKNNELKSASVASSKKIKGKS